MFFSKKFFSWVVLCFVLILCFFIFKNHQQGKYLNTKTITGTTIESFLEQNLATNELEKNNQTILDEDNGTVITKNVNIQEPKDKTKDLDKAKIIDQLFIVGMRGTTYSEKNDFGYLLKNTNVGGIILFDYDSQTKKYGKNITSKIQVSQLTKNLQNNAQTKLFIAIDEEGGAVNRLKKAYGFNPIPSAETLGTKSPQFITSEATRLGKDLKQIGVNIDFAPVVDVNVNPKSPAIGKYGRSFSADPNIVIQSATAFINGLHSQGIINSIKHYPGHGSSTADSHLGFVDITNTYKDIELLPFKELIKSKNADMVMVAHVVNKNVDKNYPASLSSVFINTKLRGELAYNGIVITDDLDMGAITNNYSFDDKIVRAINAGNNILILSNNIKAYDRDVVIKARKVIENALEKGTISWDQILNSYNKIQALKAKYKII